MVWLPIVLIGVGIGWTLVGLISYHQANGRCGCGTGEACSLCGKTLSLFRMVAAWPLWGLINRESFYVEMPPKAQAFSSIEKLPDPYPTPKELMASNKRYLVYEHHRAGAKCAGWIIPAKCPVHFVGGTEDIILMDTGKNHLVFAVMNRGWELHRTTRGEAFSFMMEEGFGEDSFAKTLEFHTEL